VVKGVAAEVEARRGCGARGTPPGWMLSQNMAVSRALPRRHCQRMGESPTLRWVEALAAGVRQRPVT
jgi:hypothetical protein